MSAARESTNAYLFAVFDKLLAEQRARRMPVRPQDAHDDEYPEFEREASKTDARNQQDREDQ